MSLPKAARYRTTNWSAYNAALRERGSLLIWQDYLAEKGVPWPFHTKAEPIKMIRLKTDLDDMGWDGLARFFSEATIHPVDAYFNFARCRVAGFERGHPDGLE